MGRKLRELNTLYFVFNGNVINDFNPRIIIQSRYIWYIDLFIFFGSRFSSNQVYFQELKLDFWLMISIFVLFLQKASLAEKEVTALKEQLAAANDGNSKTEGQHLSQNPQGAEQAHDASNPRRTPNSNFEQELQAKDKEVSIYVFIFALAEVSRIRFKLNVDKTSYINDCDKEVSN